MDRDGLIDGIRAYLQGRGVVSESAVLDGDGYFLDGHLVVAVMGEDLCLFVGREDWESKMSGDGVRPFLFAGLPVPGWVMVAGASVPGDDALAEWIESALARG